jgi:hypothetical protein
MTDKLDKLIIGNGGSLADGAVDPVSGNMKVLEQNQERFAPVTESLEDDTNIAAGTYYYPSSDGVSMFGFDSIGYDLEFTDGDGTITGTWESTKDDDLATGLWLPISKSGYEKVTNATGLASITVTNGTVQASMDFDNLNDDRIRLKIVLTGSTNAVIVKMRRKVR